jgi:fructose-1-phosphate kinase PfkB-like protein
VAAASELRRRGATLAIVTRGVHGAALATDAGTWTLGNLPASRRGSFSVGSGDAFLAGFLAGLARGLAPDAALRLAGAAGAANARTPGQGELQPDDMDRALPALTVVAG